ncbi:MAG: HAMP domain-containing sensor histidine kinase [Opitutaceae bacterium]|nr:HAMP domain-containing sensor histidine kinase [Opitutaceae bacterium]
MKITYPLSLKVSLWLLLNLVLLAALGLGFFVVQGGLGWGALVAGVAGDRAQGTANVIAGETAAATGENRHAVLARFGAAYRARFFIFRPDGTQVAGEKIELPAAVSSRLEFWPRGPRGEFGTPPDDFRRYSVDGRRPPRRDGADASGSARDPSAEPARGEAKDPPREVVLKTRRELPEASRGAPPDPARERERNRLVVRTESPARYWVGFRVPFGAIERGRPGPGGFGGGPPMLIAQIGSFWGVLRFLNLETWLLAGTAVLALSVLFWLPLMRGITHSLSQLTAATEQIAEGRFETRVPARRRDEIGRLGESVNRMAARLDAQMSGQKRFLGDVAHELCSPLARMQMATGILSEHAPPALAPVVADVREEVQHMSALVNELLAFTKAGLHRDITLEPVEIAPLVREVLDREEAAARVLVEIAAELRVLADADLLKRALANLVRNALRYGGSGPITVSARREKTLVVIAVDDDGLGVPADALDRLGDPFYRPESARTRETGGVGLGLSIVRSSVTACGGEVHFANRSPRGFRAEIRLNAA